MNVHVSKHHTDLFECGLCERSLENSPNLDTHLNTCEIFRCRMCWQERTTLSDITDHLRKKHKGPQPIIIEHLNMSRNSTTELHQRIIGPKICWKTESDSD